MDRRALLTTMSAMAAAGVLGGGMHPAAASPSRGPTHDSGTVWFARPSLEETCTLYSLPVSRRTHCHGNGVRAAYEVIN
jgi:hypothetical protein